MEEEATHTSYRWVMLTMTMMAAISLYIDMIAYAPILGDISKDLNVEISTATNLMMGFLLAAAFVLIWGGIICDSYGVTVALVLGLLCTTFPATLMPWIGHSYGLVFFCRMIQGAGVGFVFAVIGPILALWFPQKEQGLAGGLMLGSVSLGSAIGVLISPVILGIIGSWQKTVAILSILGWIDTVLVLLLTRKKPSRKVLVTLQDAMKADKREITFSKALTLPITWIGSSIIFFNSWALFCLYNLVPVFLAIPFPMGVDLGSVMSGKLSLAVTTVGIFAVVLGGIFFDKVAKGNFHLAVIIGFILTGIFAYLIILPTVYRSLSLLILSLLFAGWGIPFMNASLTAYIATNYPPAIVGRMVGWWFGVGSFGAAAGLFFGGLTIAATGNFNWAIGTISLASGMGLVLSPFLKPRKQFLAVFH